MRVPGAAARDAEPGRGDRLASGKPPQLAMEIGIERIRDPLPDIACRIEQPVLTIPTGREEGRPT